HAWRNPRYTDLDQTAANLFVVQENEYTKSFTQEIRLNSPSGGRFSYLAGAFYYWNNWGNNPISGGSNSNTAGFPITGIANTQLTQNTKAISAFASGSYDILTQLTVDVGVRYTNERKSGTMARQSTGVLGLVSLPSLPLTELQRLETNNVDYSFGVRYKPSNDLLLYATYSRGSKSGGYQDGAALPSLAPYAPETALSTEVGMKLSFNGGFFAAALFNTEVKDFQNNYTATIGGVSRALIGNADIRSRGFEISGSKRIVTGLRVNGSLVYADGTYLKNFPADGSVALKGQPLTRNPKWSGQVELTYDRKASEKVDIFGSIKFDFASKAILQSLITQAIAPVMKAHQTLNASFGLRLFDGLEISAIGTNLTDAKYVTFATGISGSGGAYAGSVIRGRVIALQIAHKF
ncbi:MAG: TonB-dependent receptor, partial [Rhodospirillales bacterium]|nr:TonB-dependent receptor [Rhodospirillales bacterium]